MQINVKQFTFITTALVAVTLLTPKASHAGANEYTLTQNINVALLRVPSAGQTGVSPTAGSLEAPYIFDILNNRPDVKPAVWHLQNPMAPSTVTNETNTREEQETGSSVQPYSGNQQITSNMAPYWEVDFSSITSVSQLTQFNLLAIRADSITALTLTQRQILRQYVDQGGTLWIDINGTAIGGTNAALDESNIFRVTDDTNISTTPSTTNFHPIVTSPNVFTGNGVDSLGYGSFYGKGGVTNGSNAYRLASSVSATVGTYPNAPDPTLFDQIGDSLIAGDYGTGHVIIDTLGIGDWINLDGGTATEYQGAWSPTTTYEPGQVVTVNRVLYQCIAASMGNQPNLDTYNANLAPYHHVYWTSNLDPYDATTYSAAPTPELKFLVNILTYATSSGTVGGNPRGTNQQGGNLAGALSSTWDYLYPSASSSSPVGIATYGKFVYTTDSLGNLNCFDINPPESIFSDAVHGDDGAVDLANRSSYDLIWTVNPASSATAISAPVVAQVPYGGVNVTVVLVEDASGNVYAYPAVYDPGSVAVSSSAPAALFKANGSSNKFAISPPPAPTYYRGELLAPEPAASGGEVAVWNLLALNGNTYQFPTTNTASSFTFTTDFGDWLQPIEVASIPSNDGTYNGDEIVGSAITSTEVQTLELGARDELYNTQGNSDQSSGSATYAGDFGQGANFTLFGALEDTYNNVQPNLWLEDFAEAPPFVISAPTLPNAKHFSIEDVPDSVYTDYNVIPGSSSTPLRVTATAATTDSTSSASNTIAGSVIGPDNNVYISVNEPSGTSGSAYVEAVNEQNPTSSSVSWRFELNGTTSTPVIDATGIGYAFNGYSLDGSPVVGNDGLVYVLATNSSTNTTAILALNANPSIGVDLAGEIDTISESDEFGQSQSQQTSQLDGHQFNNFASTAQSPMVPSLFAPGFVLVTIKPTNGGTPGPPQTYAIDTEFNGAAPFLAWYTSIPNTLATSPMRRVGDYFYFGALVSGVPETVAVYAEPSELGLEPNATNRQIVNPSSEYRFIQLTPTNLSALTVAPVGSNKYLVTGGGAGTGGTNGVEGLAYNTVLVADGNRLAEFDPSGNATWTLDSTQETTPYGSASNSSGALETTTAQSSVQLNRPSSVTQLNADDYLIADTGNNRVVHVDRSGNVLTQINDAQGNILIPTVLNDNGVTYGLEINSFSDPLGLLPTGQPLTLNHPNYVATWESYDYGSGGSTTTAINVHYLIADTGNSRVLDIVDRYTNVFLGKVFELASASDFHYLNWISRTSDIGNRKYAYISAQPVLQSSRGTYSVQYPDSVGTTSTTYITNEATAIIGAVGDKYIATLDTTQASNLATPNQDSAGSSILLLNYSNGLPFASTVKSGLPISLINSVEYIPDVSGVSNAATLLPLRGLRSVDNVVDDPVTPAIGELLITDQDGVFVGPISSASTNVNRPFTLDATFGNNSKGWSFLTNDYNAMVADYDAELNVTEPLTSGTHQDFLNTTFAPVSAISVPGNNVLISNRGAYGNQNAPSSDGEADNGFGGDVLTVHVSASGPAPPVDSLVGPIIGKPANTGALSAPAFALQSN